MARIDKKLITITWYLEDFVDAYLQRNCIEESDLSRTEYKALVNKVDEAIHNSDECYIEGLREAMIADGNERIFWMVGEAVDCDVRE